MLNKAILMGRLVRDPEMRRTQSNTAFASFTLAIDRDRKDADGNKQTDFIDCVAWSYTAEFLCKYFTKGSMAVVCGRIQSRNWEDKNRNKRTSIEVNGDEINFGESKKQVASKTSQVDANGFDDVSDTFDDSDVPF